MSTDLPAIPETWDVSEIPSLKGKVAIVTGANSGLGYETALQLALKGAHVVLACRDEAKGLEAASQLVGVLGTEPDRGSVQFLQLDVSDLASVRRFAESFKQGHDRLDLLVNNAGVMGGSYTLSKDGLERLFATNHLGHFALTAQLFHLLKQSSASRVVNVSSRLHKRGEASFNEDEIMVTSPDKFGQVQTYGETKLCNILFTIELDRRLRTAGLENVTAVACHPGYVATNLGANMAAANDNWLYWLLIKLMTFLPGGKTPEMGAIPTLYAATGNEVVGGDYIGPKDRSTGSPARHEPATLCQSKSGANKLWAFSEKLANVTFVVEK
ncbi:Retinol dehydrogenase [Phytophthora megakarya]|uniref:Retinol dehydrogenase n=1 Tax=Phytophthora megakarya TaxID=4795 RepID=A0A225VJD7_9STRA|nr:Retinol dehydrogenase [Phytophthora megakarya]